MSYNTNSYLAAQNASVGRFANTMPMQIVPQGILGKVAPDNSVSPISNMATSPILTSTSISFLHSLPSRLFVDAMQLFHFGG